MKENNNEETNSLIKTIKKEATEEKSPQPYGKIYLNTVIYDKREPISKHNNITFAQLLH